jgi:hypothetical protein
MVESTATTDPAAYWAKWIETPASVSELDNALPAGWRETVLREIQKKLEEQKAPSRIEVTK